MDIEKIKLYFYSFKTKIGEIYYIWSESAPDTENQKTGKANYSVNFIGLGEEAFNSYMNRIAKNFCKSEPVILENRNKHIEDEINNFLNGKSKKINLEPYFLFGSDFEKSVWSVLMTIPFGQTISYKEVSVLAERPDAWRAAGTAIGKNPLLLLVPCHRVIKSTGEIGYFSCGVEIKKFLLDLESC